MKLFDRQHIHRLLQACLRQDLLRTYRYRELLRGATLPQVKYVQEGTSAHEWQLADDVWYTLNKRHSSGYPLDPVYLRTFTIAQITQILTQIVEDIHSSKGV